MKKSTKKIIIWSVSSVASLIILIVGLLLVLLTPTRLTPLVNEYADKYLEANVNFDTVDMSWWEEFPMVTLKLRNGSVLSKIFPQRSDTLLSFSEFKLTVDLLSLVKGEINTRRVSVKHPTVSIFVDSTGRANYEIYHSTDTTTSESDFRINIDRITLSDGVRIRYVNQADSIEAEANFERLRLNGKFTNIVDNIQLSSLRLLNLNYRLKMDSLTISQSVDSLILKKREGLRYNLSLNSRAQIISDTTTNYRIDLLGDVRLDSVMTQNRALGVDSLLVQLNDIKVMLGGDVTLRGDSIYSDMKLSVHPLHFANVAEFLPRNMPIETDLKADIDTRIKGVLTGDLRTLPRVELNMELRGGSFKLYQYEQDVELKDVMCRAFVQFDMQKPDSTGFVIDTMNLASDAVNLHGRVEVWNLLRDPKINANLRARVDLERVKALQTIETIDTARGVVEVAGSCRLTLSDFTPKKIGRCDIRLKLTSADFKLSMPQQEVDLMARQMSMNVASSASSRDTTLIEKGTRILRVSMRADTAALRVGDMMYANAGDIRVSARSAASKYSGDTTIVHPFVGTVSARMVQVGAADSSRIRIREPQISFTVLPYQKNRAVPELSAQLSARHVMMSSQMGRWSLSRPEFEAKARLAASDPNYRLGRERRLDSLQRLYPLVERDSLVVFAAMMNTLMRAKDDFVVGDIDMKLDDEFGRLLRRWNVEGSLKASRSRVITPLLPLTNRVENLDITFSHNDVNLKRTRLVLGESNMVVTGSVGNLRRALLGRGALTLNVEVDADTINFNQLIVALNQGTDLTNQRGAFDDAQSDQELQRYIDRAASANIENSLIIIPSNINAEIKINANYGKYASLELRELKTVLQMKERCMQLTYVLARTTSGDMTLSGIYATKSRDDITFGIDVQMDKMHVDKLIEMVPEIDTLYPMLRSFEGVIDCKMAATAALDTLMNVKLETLRAACSIDGSDMVLLDGETFTEISKMMKFRNRKRNLIDRISVEMLIRDSKVETFPFVLSMDRYKAAISGIHRLDMSFDYHISVLKSPLPFRLGVDIFGTLDDWDFKIGRAKYKNENVPSYVELIEQTRMNLSRKIYEIFQKGIASATLENISSVQVANDTIVPQARIEQLTPADSVLLRENGIIE